jgi:predicted Rossmann fold flavoprotein
MQGGGILKANQLIIATGSNPQGLKWAAQFGHKLVPSVPSLFTFNVPSSPLKELSGVSVEPANVQIEGTKYTQTGPLLITHFGFSGPAVLKLSAWAARDLFDKKYTFKVVINWIPNQTYEEAKSKLILQKEETPKKSLNSISLFPLPKKLWKNFLLRAGDIGGKQLSNLSKKDIKSLLKLLQKDSFSVSGKTTNKEEFVTCGGVLLSEINFKTMESKLCKGLYFSGEILNIDGITGGFNFQSAWTTGHIAGMSSAS